MKPKACIFDLDGTLVNSIYDLASACNYTLEKYGFSGYTTDEYYNFVGNGVKNLMIRIFAQHMNAKELSTKLPDILNVFQDYYSKHVCDKTIAYDNIDKVLSLLRNHGVKLAVVSNKPDRFVPQVLEATVGAKWFVEMVGEREGVPRKPDPTSVMGVLQNLGVSPECAIYIGDSDVDILTAKNSGTMSLGVAYGFRGREELENSGADIVCDTVDDLYDYFNNILTK